LGYWSLQATLESLGFFPTVYYPAFISEDRGCIDAVQFTRVLRRDMSGTIEAVEDLDDRGSEVMKTASPLNLEAKLQKVHRRQLVAVQFE